VNLSWPSRSVFRTSNPSRMLQVCPQALTMRQLRMSHLARHSDIWRVCGKRCSAVTFLMMS
jgi:hypothetical protein